MDDFGQVGDLGGHLGAKMGPDFFKKNFRSRGKWEALDRLGSAGGRGVSSGRVRVGINPTRVGLLSVIVSSYTATAALGGAAPDLMASAFAAGPSAFVMQDLTTFLKMSDESFKFCLKILKFEAPEPLWNSWTTPWREHGPRCELGRVGGSNLQGHDGLYWCRDGAKVGPIWR